MMPSLLKYLRFMPEQSCCAVVEAIEGINRFIRGKEGQEGAIQKTILFFLSIWCFDCLWQLSRDRRRGEEQDVHTRKIRHCAAFAF